MPPKTIVVSETSYPDTGLQEFSFLHRGKKYKVLPKPGAGDRLEKFLRYVKYVCPKSGTEPWTYPNWKQYFEVERVNGGPAQKPEESTQPKEPEQMKLTLAGYLDRVAESLESRGYIQEAYRVDILANTLEKTPGNRATLFSDEIANQDIKSEDAKKVLDAYEEGADTEHSVAKVTGLDSWTCKKVLDIAHKHKLLK